MVVRSPERTSSDASNTRSGPARPALLRTLNDEVALRLLLERGQLSRSDMVRLIGVSKPTGSQILARLEAAELVLPVGVTRGRPGRAALLYEINPAAGFAAALDVTPRRIHAQVADITGAVIGEFQLHRPSRASGSGPANARAALDHALQIAGLNRSKLSCVVVAATGSYDAEADRIRYARRLSGWNDVGLMKSLRSDLGVDVYIENDVNLAAVAEHRVGAAQHISDFFLFWADEGIGGALMLENRLRRGVTGGAGEIAFLQPAGAAVVHNPVRGGSGGLEQWAGGNELVELARAHDVHGANPAELVATAVSSDLRSATEFINELALRFAIGLSAVIAVIDPGAIVLAGSVMAAGGERLRALISRHLEDVAITSPQLLSSSVAGNAVLAGALHTSLDHARTSVFQTA
ncbi:MAG TPA: ROK family transcriptional regulator [Actinomycetes bacterium]|nr:ROK family transcriptional regulator [Actinomycetes bacterium]